MSNCQSASKSNTGGHCTTMVIPSMVSTVGDNVDRSTYSTASGPSNPVSISQLQLSDSRRPAPIDRVQGLRLRFQADGISEEAIKLILASWRSKTDANYNSAWRKWQGWCNEKGANLILGFLATEFGEGKQYRSLNCFRSAISSAHLPVDGFPVGRHPLVCRLLKGAFNSRPPQPRYEGTWDVTRVTSYFREKGGNSKLSLKELTMKLAMLLALALASRSSGLARLTVAGVRYIPEGVELIPKGLAKQARPGKEQTQKPIIVPQFSEEVLRMSSSMLEGIFGGYF